MAVRYSLIRPCHQVGLFLKQAKDNTITHKELLKKFKGIESVQKGLDDATYEAMLSKVIMDDLTRDEGHGGSEIKITKINGEVTEYRLLTPEYMNEFGQNIIYPHQWEAYLAANDHPQVTKKPSLPRHLAKDQTAKGAPPLPAPEKEKEEKKAKPKLSALVKKKLAGKPNKQKLIGHENKVVELLMIEGVVEEVEKV